MTKSNKANKVRYLSASQLARHEVMADIPRARIEYGLANPQRAYAHGIAVKTKGQHRGCLVVQSEKELVRFAGWVRAMGDGMDGTAKPLTLDASARVSVPIGEFVTACEQAVADARGLALVHKGKNYENLMRYKVDVTAGGVTAQMRLDLACALLKRRSLPLDAYGETIQGAVICTSPNPHWIISYNLGVRVTSASDDAGSIDHLVPRSAGGKSVLCNLQVMRKVSNSIKSSATMPDVSGEPQESMAVLRVLARGIRRAGEEGTLPRATRASIEKVMRGEFAACLEMLSPGDVARLAVGLAGGRVAGAVTGLAKRVASSAASLASAPRQTLRQGVSSALVSSLMSV